MSWGATKSRIPAFLSLLTLGWLRRRGHDANWKRIVKVNTLATADERWSEMFARWIMFFLQAPPMVRFFEIV